MTSNPPNEHIADAEPLQGYRYLVWMEFEALGKNKISRVGLTWRCY